MLHRVSGERIPQMNEVTQLLSSGYAILFDSFQPSLKQTLLGGSTSLDQYIGDFAFVAVGIV